MTIFSKKAPVDKREEKVVIGAQVPQSLSEYFSLYCFFEAIPKSSIIQRQLAEFKSENEKEGKTIEFLIKELIKKAIENYKNSNLTLIKFVINLRKELDKSCIRKELIEEIIQQIKNEEKNK